MDTLLYDIPDLKNGGTMAAKLRGVSRKGHLSFISKLASSLYSKLYAKPSFLPVLKTIAENIADDSENAELEIEKLMELEGGRFQPKCSNSFLPSSRPFISLYDRLFVEEVLRVFYEPDEQRFAKSDNTYILYLKARNIVFDCGFEKSDIDNEMCEELHAIFINESIERILLAGE